MRYFTVILIDYKKKLMGVMSCLWATKSTPATAQVLNWKMFLSCNHICELNFLTVSPLITLLKVCLNPHYGCPNLHHPLLFVLIFLLECTFQVYQHTLVCILFSFFSWRILPCVRSWEANLSCIASSYL